MHNEETQEPRKDFFISYSSADRTWAEWIDWQLKTEGYSTILPDQGLGSVGSFAPEIENVFKESSQVIVVISPYYLNALYAQLEWAVVLRQEATKQHGRLIVIQVRECRRVLKSLVDPSSFIDLVIQDESEAGERLLTSIRESSKSSMPNGSAIESPLHIDKSQQAYMKRRLSFLRQKWITRGWSDFDMDGLESASLPLHNIPYQRNEFFTDREEILKSLYEVLSEGRATGFSNPLALSGLGGIGKTQIALEYAYRYKDEYYFILWANADSKSSLISDFVSMARALRLPERDLPDYDQVVAAVKLWLQDNTHWLLILDNVNDPAMASDFIPVGSNGDVLITTCAYAMGTIAQNVVVGNLEPRDGAKLLANRLKTVLEGKTLEMLSDVDRNAVEKISRDIDGIPLALDQAGAYIEKMQCTLADYLKDYSDSRRRAVLLRERGTPTFAHPDSVMATWLLSFENVSKANPAAADLLRLSAFLSSESIPEEIITKGTVYLGPRLGPVAASPFDLDRAIEELHKFSLISRNADKNTLSMHSLLQEVLKSVMQDDDERRLWAERTVRAVNHIFPDEEFSVWEQCERYSSQAIGCADLIKEWNMQFPEAARLLHEAGSYLFERAQFEQAKALYEQALTIRKSILEPDDLQIARSYNDLAWYYRTVSEYEQAEELFKQALTIREKQLGPDDPQVAQTLNGLAWLYYNRGKYKEAEPLYQHALAIRERALGPDDPDVAISLNNLAWLYYMQGRYREAEPLYQRALAIREQILPPTYPDLADGLDNLARLNYAQSNYERAEILYKRALAIREQAFGEHHPDLALSYNELARLYYAQGEYEEAEKLYLLALVTRQRLLGQGHPHVARTLNDLGRLYRAQGKYQEAEQSFLRSLAIRERVLGLEHPDVAQTLNSLARLYRTQGKYRESEQLYLRAMRISKQALSPEHPDVAQILNNLARLYRIQGKYQESEQLHHEALAFRSKALGDEHLDVAQTLNNLVKLYRLQGRYAQAEQLSKRAYALWEKTLGPKHPYLALILNNRAEVYQAEGRNSEAEEIYQRALKIQTKATGWRHTNVALILNHLAEIEVNKGQYETAKTLLQQALDIRRGLFGEGHPHIAHSLDILSEVYRAQNQYNQAKAYLQQAIDIRRQTLGANHPDLASSLYNLAEVYVAQGRYEEAEPLYREALTIREESLGGDHFVVAVTLCQLADIYQEQRKYSSADPLYERALAIHEHDERKNWDEMLRVVNHFATLLRKMGRPAKAMELVARIQKMRDAQIQESPPSHKERERD